jgi:XTP/dITP diphosphohydrolase
VSSGLVRARPELVLATSNPGKLSELRALLADLPFALLALDALPEVRLREEGDDYEANAVAKACAIARSTGRAALADDSGLEVAALGGAPGPRSARFGGPGLDDAARVAKLLEAIGPARDRHARFVCIAALARPGGEAITARGECRGRILNAPQGRGGFGYDPVFEPEGRGCSMAELPAREKNAISHRARAVAALLPALREAVRAGGGAPPGASLASKP